MASDYRPETEHVRIEVVGGVATITLDRPKVNALNAEIQDELKRLAGLIADDADVVAVVLSGGDKVFAAGADIVEMGRLSHAEMVRRAARLQASFTALAELPQPVVAAVNGYALGGGCELAMTADVRIVGESAKFGQPEIKLGIIPGAGGTQRLSRLVGPSKAKNIIFTGRMVEADEALRIGLADEVVPDDQVQSRAQEWAAQFVGGPRLALRAAKESIDLGLGSSLSTGLRIESQQFAALFATRDREIGMTSFVEHGPGKAEFVGE